MDVPVSFHMTPVKRSHISSDFVPKINFIIHILWVSGISFTTCSVLAYYYRIFQRSIKSGKDKAMIWVPFSFVLAWAISSVSFNTHRVRQQNEKSFVSGTKLICTDLTCTVCPGLAPKSVLDYRPK